MTVVIDGNMTARTGLHGLPAFRTETGHPHTLDEELLMSIRRIDLDVVTDGSSGRSTARSRGAGSSAAPARSGPVRLRESDFSGLSTGRKSAPDQVESFPEDHGSPQLAQGVGTGPSLPRHTRKPRVPRSSLPRSAEDLPCEAPGGLASSEAPGVGTRRFRRCPAVGFDRPSALVQRRSPGRPLAGRSPDVFRPGGRIRLHFA